MFYKKKYLKVVAELENEKFLNKLLKEDTERVYQTLEESELKIEALKRELTASKKELSKKNSNKKVKSEKPENKEGKKKTSKKK